MGVFWDHWMLWVHIASLPLLSHLLSARSVVGRRVREKVAAWVLKVPTQLLLAIAQVQMDLVVANSMLVIWWVLV